MIQIIVIWDLNLNNKNILTLWQQYFRGIFKFIVWFVVWLVFNSVGKKVYIYLIIFSTYVPKCNLIFWNCSWTWHLPLFLSKVFRSWKIFLHWNYLKIDIHESIHVKLKLVVMTKHLQQCIFIHIFIVLPLNFRFRQFFCFICKNLQQVVYINIWLSSLFFFLSV